MFNAAQCAGKGVERLRCPALPSKPFINFHPADEAIIATQADIRQGGNSAFYNVKGDYIQLPQKTSFATESDYYSTAMHEFDISVGPRNPAEPS